MAKPSTSTTPLEAVMSRFMCLSFGASGVWLVVLRMARDTSSSMNLRSGKTSVGGLSAIWDGDGHFKTLTLTSKINLVAVAGVWNRRSSGGGMHKHDTGRKQSRGNPSPRRRLVLQRPFPEQAWGPMLFRALVKLHRGCKKTRFVDWSANWTSASQHDVKMFWYQPCVLWPRAEKKIIAKRKKSEIGKWRGTRYMM